MSESRTPDLKPIRGGFHFGHRDDGRCVHIMRMLYNWRIVVVALPDECEDGGYLHGWCYFGHGVNDSGEPRDMQTAMVAALLAARVWDGYGDPPGFDEKAF